MTLQHTIFRAPPKSTPKVIAIFSYRYDADLVPALIENLRPLVHGFVSCDDRSAVAAMSNEPARRNALHAAARDLGADWILAVDPDERYETALADRIGDLTADRDSKALWVFHLREMFSETAYRTDGIWGGKTQMRLYPARATTNQLDQALHGQWVNAGNGFRHQFTGLNLYHLRHISPLRTIHRRDTYAAADPERRYRASGYDYLADMRGATLREIAKGREFHPPYVEDHGLWAAPVIAEIGKADPDPQQSRLREIDIWRKVGGSDGAAYFAETLLNADPADADIRAMAATLALQAGRADDALAIVRGGSGDKSVLARLTEANAADRLGKGRIAKPAFGALRAQAEPSQVISSLAQARRRATADFASTGALWRRWVKGAAVLHEGSENGTGRLCTIVVSYQAPQSLAIVVAAVRAQSRDVEIVVVNSGGGDAAGVLRDYLPHIRLIDVAERLYVGGARNIGIDATRAPYVSFLADDCVPLAGWVAARLAHHDAGAAMVASAVLPSRPATVQGHTVRILLFSRRDPRLSDEEALMYGRSYHRSVFDWVGFFAPGLRIAEDTEFNKRADVLGPAVWAPEIVVQHLDPPSTWRVLAQVRLRAMRFAMHARSDQGAVAGQNRIAGRLADMRHRMKTALRQVDDLGWLQRLMLRAALAVGVRATEYGYSDFQKIETRAEELKLAAQLTTDSDPVAAIDLMQQAAALLPQDWRMQVDLGRLYLGQNTASSLDSALACFARAATIAPIQHQPLMAATKYLMSHGMADRAFAICEQAILTAPTNAGQLLEAAHIARRIKRPELARYFAQLALLANAASPAVHDLLELLHREADRPDMAQRRKTTAERLRGKTAQEKFS